ncbi:MAG TPA: replication-relaxation family protein [Candidatus Angelobacter sp.]|nr:replication-relaxation family protein [Candidatus Angelobacter sp.]
MQKRLPKFKRTPEALAGKPVTERGLLIIATIARFRFLTSSDIVRLVGGNEDVTHRHLQQLYHQDFVSRIALPKSGGYGQFIYFLDNSKGLRHLAEHSKLDPALLDWNEIKSNKDKYRDGANDGVGKFLFLQHELMISHFRSDLEIAATSSGGRVVITKWMQGSSTWGSAQNGRKALPHRPDAFFSLEFPNAAQGQQRSNFFYEADRGTSSLTRMKEKFEAHLLFLLQRKHTDYGVQKIRAVLIHAISESRAQQLMAVAAQLAENIPLAAHLFWFTSDELAKENTLSPHLSILADSRKRSLLD